MLTDTEIEALVRRIARRVNPDKIILFGSHAKGSASIRSDVDLLVIVETDVAEPHRTRLLPPLPIGALDVDIHIYTPEEVDAYRSDPISFISNVIRSGRTVFERTPTAAAASISDRPDSSTKPGDER